MSSNDRIAQSIIKGVISCSGNSFIPSTFIMIFSRIDLEVINNDGEGLEALVSSYFVIMVEWKSW
jgi:hypothetical protein